MVFTLNMLRAADFFRRFTLFSCYATPRDAMAFTRSVPMECAGAAPPRALCYARFHYRLRCFSPMIRAPSLPRHCRRLRSAAEITDAAYLMRLARCAAPKICVMLRECARATVRARRRKSGASTQYAHARCRGCLYDARSV